MTRDDSLVNEGKLASDCVVGRMGAAQQHRAAIYMTKQV
jgi:hypothetical protein